MDLLSMLRRTFYYSPFQKSRNKLKKMATRKGLEPSTSGVTGRRSNRLSYRAICKVLY